MGVAVLSLCADFQRRRQHSATTAHRAVCQCVKGQPWACQGAPLGQMQPLQCVAGVVGPALGAAAGLLGRWYVGVAVSPVCGGVQRRRQHWVTTAHRALPVCEWPALSMLWGTARLNSACVVCIRCGGACTGGCGSTGQVVCGGGCGSAGQVVVCGGGGFAGLWRFPEEETELGHQSTQTRASVRVASPGHAMGHCKVKCSLCLEHQVWWALHWRLRPSK